jgi:signal transduction histidine kinase
MAPAAPHPAERRGRVVLVARVLVPTMAWAGAAWFAVQRHEDATAEALAIAGRAAQAAQRLVATPIDSAMALLSAAEAQAPDGNRDRDRDRGMAAALPGRMGRDGLQFAAITDAAGRIQWSSHPPLSGQSLAERPTFAQHQAGRAETLLTPALLDLPGGPRSLLVSRPLADPRGAFAGIAVVALDPRRLDLALADAALLPGLRLALLRPDGTPLAQQGGNGTPALWPPPPRSPVPILHPAGDGLPTLALAAIPVAQELHLLAAYDPASLQGAAAEAGWLGFLAAFLLSLAALGLPFGRRMSQQGVLPAEDALPAIGYRGIVEPGGVLRMTRIGAGIERLTGWTADAALRPGWRQRGMDAGSLPIGPEVEERLRRDATATTEYRFRRADGAWMWLRETVRVIARRPDGIEVSGALEDISAERELALQAATSAKFATLGEMAAGLAHELNQPIAIMSLAAENAAEALEAGEDGVEEALTRLRRIMAQADRAKAIVTQLRAFSRVDVAALEPVDLGAAVQGMMVLAGQALRDAGVQVQLRLPDVLPPVVGQIILVEQVLLNLVLNARDALLERPTERRRLRIQAEAGDQPETVTLRVLDTGPGLTAETLEKLFEPFYTTKPPGLGTGLGLSISRTIMRGLGGQILASNAPAGSDMGAEFTLVFRRAALPAAAVPSAAASRILEAAPAPRWPAAT